MHARRLMYVDILKAALSTINHMRKVYKCIYVCIYLHTYIHTYILSYM